VFTSAILLSPVDTTEKAVALFARGVELHPQKLHAAFLDRDMVVIALRYLDWRADLTIQEHVRDLAREGLCFGASNLLVARRKLDDEPLVLDDVNRACAPVMQGALAPFGIMLRDCLIIAPEGYVSMADHGVL
jgi:hypothetical protein